MTTKTNTYFTAMQQAGTEFEQARTARQAEKEDILKSGGNRTALAAWHEREKGIRFPFTDGQTKAYRAWFSSVQNQSSTFEVQGLPWPDGIHDFVETLQAAGVAEFAVTDRSTGLMEGLHGLAAEGCTMQGLCTVTRSESRRSGGTAEYQGILFHT